MAIATGSKKQSDLHDAMILVKMRIQVHVLF